MAPHEHDGPPAPARLLGVVALAVDLGTVAGQRIILLGVEVWHGWADLRFARIDVGADRPLPRRVPPPAAWRVAADGHRLEIVDAVGRGDRSFSNGEVRVRPAPPEQARLDVEVEVVPGQPPLVGSVALPPWLQPDRR